MRFRMEYSVNKLRLYGMPGEGVSVDVGGPHNIKVTFRNPTKEENS